MKWDTFWLPLSHRQQRHKSDCLATCTAMILDYLNRPVRYKRLMKLLDPGLGTPASKIKRLSSLNLSVEYSPGTLDDLAEQVRNPSVNILGFSQLNGFLQGEAGLNA